MLPQASRALVVSYSGSLPIFPPLQTHERVLKRAVFGGMLVPMLLLAVLDGVLLTAL